MPPPFNYIHAAWGLVVAPAPAGPGRCGVRGQCFSGGLQMSWDTHTKSRLFLNTLPLRLNLREITCEAELGEAYT